MPDECNIGYCPAIRMGESASLEQHLKGEEEGGGGESLIERS